MEKWNIIVITCSSSALAACVEEEVTYLQKKNRISQLVPVLAIEDPAEHIGSGAATFNGLLVATEYLSVQKNYSVVNSDVLTGAHILIVHQGRDCIYSSCGKSLITVPQSCIRENFESSSRRTQCTSSGVFTNLELLFDVIGRLSQNSPPGVWVCSTDMSLMLKKDISLDWHSVSDVVLFCVPTAVKYAVNHGCVDVDEKGHVTSIIYCESEGRIEKSVRKDGSVLIVSGIVFLSSEVANSLLSLYSISPIESCTYVGLDSGAEPVQVSLFFDILMSMAVNTTKEDYLAGNYGKTYNVKVGYCEERIKKMVLARTVLWRELSKFKMSAEVLDKCLHFYWTDQLPVKCFISNLLSMKVSSCCHAVLKAKESSISRDYLLMNSIIQVDEDCTISSGTVITNSQISAVRLNLGKDCYLSGLNTGDLPNDSLNIPDGTVILSFDPPDFIQDQVVAVFGTDDELSLPRSHPQSTFANKPWRELFERLKISENDIWGCDTELSEQNLLNARLYTPKSSLVNFTFLISGTSHDFENLTRWKGSPKYSLVQLLKCANYSQQLNQRRCIYSLVAAEKVKQVLLNNEDSCLLPYFVAASAEGWPDVLLDALDSILLSETSYVTLTRTLSAMADLLGIMAGKAGGLRTGPGSNKSWSTAFNYLLTGETVKGMLELKHEREKWLSKPSSIMRAARHYERAVQILIQNCLQTTRKFINLSVVSWPEIESWVVVECPARIDLQGGWSDTPPICYELGGSVVNAAVLIDGKKPICAKGRRKKDLNIELVFGQQESPTRLIIRDKSEILDFDQPYAQGALLKAALICADVVDINSDLSLNEQLLNCCNSGLELHSYSNLPHGCGMGTSSILAGAVIAVLWSLIGKQFKKSSVIHAVLCVEQLLTTGGGWQDQIGGIMGGVNRGFSKAALPLHVEVHQVCIPEAVLEKLNKHFMLIYTGKVRLAKNILQNVIRNWYARDYAIVSCFRTLVSASFAMEEALVKGDLPQVGALMNQYWEQKKVLAPGCEPYSVKLIMDVLKPICYGQILVGAGGGGFMCILTKVPCTKEMIKNFLIGNVTGDVTCHSASLDSSGMTISLENVK